MIGTVWRIQCALSAISIATFSCTRTSAQSHQPSGDSVQVLATVDKSEVRVAERIRFMLQVVAPQGTRIILPEIGDKLGEFDVLSRDTLRDIPIDDQPRLRSWTMQIGLESIDTGTRRIPALTVEYSEAGDPIEVASLESISSQPLDVEVISVLSESDNANAFRDIKDVLDVERPSPYAFHSGWAITLGIAALMICIFIGWRRQRRPTMTIEEWALAEIDDLRSQRPLELTDPAVVYGELTSIVRRFLSLRFAESAESIYSENSATDANTANIVTSETRAALIDFFRRAEQVRFARQHLTPEQVQDTVARARSLIRMASAAKRGDHVS